jgi:hypothetical protein
MKHLRCAFAHMVREPHHDTLFEIWVNYFLKNLQAPNYFCRFFLGCRFI